MRVGKYQRVEFVPNAQFSYDAMRLFRYCENKGAVWEAVMEYVDAIRPKGASIIEPPEKQFTGIDKDAYEALAEGAGVSVKNYWVKVGVNTDNRNTQKDNDDTSTSGRPAVDDITNKPINHIINNLTNQTTKQEVCDFVEKEGLALDGEDFFAEMEKRGWQDKDGQPLRDWRKLALSWAKPRRKERIFPSQDYNQRDYTEAELQERAREQELLDEAKREKP